MKTTCKKLSMVLLSVSFVLSCGGLVAAQASDDVEFTVQMVDGAKMQSMTPNPVVDEIQKRVGVKLKFVDYSEDKVKLQLAGGDLPDLSYLKPQYFKQAIEGNQVLALDDLVAKYGPEIQKNFADTIKFYKKFYSNGTGKLYFLPIQVGPGGLGFEQQNGWSIRWDYYREIGAPAIKNETDLLKTLAKIQAKHPANADGKKVYGVGSWNDWGEAGLWGFTYPISGGLMGLYDISSGYGMTSDGANSLVAYFRDENSPIFRNIRFLFQANQMGLLDPDSLIQKNVDFVAKYTAGRYLWSPVSWDNGTANKALGEGKGYEPLPMEGVFLPANGPSPIGWNDKSWFVSKNCKNPEKAVKLLNFLWSPEGARLITSGLKGTHWDLVNGKPKLLDSTLALQAKGGADWDKTGISVGTLNWAKIQGMSDFSVNPADKGYVNLFMDPDLFSKQLSSTLDKDYCSFYKAPYPAAVLNQLFASGKSRDMSKNNPLIAGALVERPDDIKRIDSNLAQITARNLGKLVLAPNEASYTKAFQGLKDELKAAGAEKSYAWWTKAWADAKKAVE